MPCVFQRLQRYCTANELPLPPLEQRVELSRAIAHYYTNNQAEFPFKLSRRSSIEPEGVFNVIFYPHKFNEKMDEMIAEYYKTLPPIPVKKERKRIPLKATKIKY